MSVNKVELKNGETLIDISGDTVRPEFLRQGYTAHNAAGEQITGSLSGTAPILLEKVETVFVTQRHITADISALYAAYKDLTIEQIIIEFAQIGAYEASVTKVSELYKSYNSSTGAVDITTSEDLFRSNKKNILNIYLAV